MNRDCFRHFEIQLQTASQQIVVCLFASFQTFDLNMRCLKYLPLPDFRLRCLQTFALSFHLVCATCLRFDGTYVLCAWNIQEFGDCNKVNIKVIYIRNIYILGSSGRFGLMVPAVVPGSEPFGGNRNHQNRIHVSNLNRSLPAPAAGLRCNSTVPESAARPGHGPPEPPE